MLILTENVAGSDKCTLDEAIRQTGSYSNIFSFVKLFCEFIAILVFIGKN